MNSLRLKEFAACEGPRRSRKSLEVLWESAVSLVRARSGAGSVCGAQSRPPNKRASGPFGPLDAQWLATAFV